MILSEVRQAVRSNLDDMQYDGSKIDQAINWFQNELFNNNRTSLMETSATLNLTQGASSVDLPSDLQVIIDITVTSPSVYSINKLKVDQTTFSERYSNYAGSTQQQAGEWTVYGRSLRFSAPVSAATTIRLDYVRRPATATDASPTLEAPDQYFELYVLGAQARIMEINEDFAEAAQIRGNLDPLVTTFIRNEGRGGTVSGPIVIRSNRRRMGGRFGDPYGWY